MDLEVRVLQAKVEAGFENVGRRLDAQDEQASDRHKENVDRLEAIEQEVRMTNGRVTRHDEQLKTLFERVRELGLRLLPPASTRADLKWYVTLFGAGFGAALAILKLIGKL
jgi:hypothetical protein